VVVSVGCIVADCICLVELQATCHFACDCMRIVCAFCCDGGGCLSTSSLTAPRGRLLHSLEDFYVVGVGVCFHSKTPKARRVWTRTSCVTRHVGISNCNSLCARFGLNTASFCGHTSTTAWPRRTVSVVTNFSDLHLRTWS
jgi:hypothetical protein